jgi:hypothetical protein
MKIPSPLLLLLVCCISNADLRAQALQTIVFANVGSGLSRQQDISVQSGERFEIVTWAASYNGPSSIKVDGVEVVMTAVPTSTNTRPLLAPTFSVAGPRIVTIDVSSNASLLCSYKLVPNGEVASQSVASQVVVIPQSVSAPADIILESSTDLVVWTAALPGSYSPAASNRFFRVRLVLQ